MYDEDNVVVERLKAAYAVARRQATETLALVRKTELLKDRDVQIALGIVAASVLFMSKVLFGAAIGYLVYHYVRRDDHVRNALEAASRPADEA